MISPLISQNRKKFSKNTRLDSNLFDQEAVIMSDNKKDELNEGVSDINRAATTNISPFNELKSSDPMLDEFEQMLNGN